MGVVLEELYSRIGCQVRIDHANRFVGMGPVVMVISYCENVDVAEQQ